MSLDIKLYKSKHQNHFKMYNLHPALPQHPFRMIISGSSGSGKTNLVKNLLLNKKFYKNRFDNIYIMSSTYYINNDYEDIDVDVVSTTYNEDFIDTILELQNENLDDTKGLLIIDDMSGMLPKSQNSKLANLFFRARHHNLSIMLLTQYYYNVPKNIRCNCSNIIIFNTENQNELKSLTAENCCHLKDQNFMSVFKYACNEPYSFLHIDYNEKNKHKRYRKKFQTILNTDQSL
jgi:tRNA A37 threonylcarbamoyladenosine biosynthesis protein TsaE